MARKADQKAVTAKMYRHFAVVTLIATAALAMASDDDNADKLNAEVAAQEAAIAAKGKDIKKNNQATVIKRSGKPAPAASGWGSDEGGSDGSGGGGGGVSSYVPQGIGGKGVTVGMLRQLKLTPAQFMAMSAEEQAKVMERLNGGDGEKKMSQAEQARVQQTVSNASLARSGFQGPCSDC